jgi:hypothetical protein
MVNYSIAVYPSGAIYKNLLDISQTLKGKTPKKARLDKARNKINKGGWLMSNVSVKNNNDLMTMGSSYVLSTDTLISSSLSQIAMNGC